MKKTVKTLTEKSKKKPKGEDKRTLKAKADAVFSRYIRLRDSEDGMHGACITCGVVKPIKEMDNGHYITRNVLSTRFDERNCNLQCKSCNGFYEGRKPEYGIALEMKYGEGIIDELIRISQKTTKISVAEYQAMIDYYTDKVEELDVYKLWRA